MTAKPMATPAAFTRDDILKCCENHLDNDGNVILGAAYHAVRILVNQPISRQTARGLGNKVRNSYPSVWERAKPEKAENGLVLHITKAVDFFVGFDLWVRRALALPRAKPEVPRRKLPNQSEDASGDESDSDTSPAEEQQDEPEETVAMETAPVDGALSDDITMDHQMTEIARGEIDTNAAASAGTSIQQSDGVVLTAQQAANVLKKLAIVNPFEEAYRKSRKSEDGTMVLAKDMIAHLYNLDDKQATKKLEKLKERHPVTFDAPPILGEPRKNESEHLNDSKPTHCIFHPLPLLGGNRPTIANFCRPIDMLRWFIDIDEVKHLGIARDMKDTFIRSLGGDESMISEIQVTARATAGTIIASIARSDDVGSSSSSPVFMHTEIAQTIARNPPAHELCHGIYTAWAGHGIIKIGETKDIDRRDRELSPSEIAFALYLATVEPRGHCKMIESNIQAWLAPALVPGKIDHFFVDKICQILHISSDTHDLENAVMWAVFEKIVQLVETLKLADGARLLERRDNKFVHLTNERYSQLSQQFKTPDLAAPASACKKRTGAEAFGESSGWVDAEKRVKILEAKASARMQEAEALTCELQAITKAARAGIPMDLLCEWLRTKM